MDRDCGLPACFLFLLLSLALGAGPARADYPFPYDAPPVVTVYPDDLPLDVGFQFPGGGAAERFTGNRDAWYSLYRLVMRQGVSYTLAINHDGDRDRLRIYALDNHPFGQVGMKYELKLTEKEGLSLDRGRMRTFVAGMALPDDVLVAEIFLLLEWIPRFDKNRPLPVLLQVVSTYPFQRPGSRQQYSWDRGMAPEHADLYARPVTLPLKKPEFPGLKDWRQR